MTNQRQNTTIIEIARDLMAVASPITGVRSSGTIRVRAKAEKGTVYLPSNWALLAQVNQASRDEMIFKISAGPNRAKFPNGKRQKSSDDEPNATSWWTVTEQGTDVDIISLIGGHRHNLSPGTRLVFDPPHPDLEDEAFVVGPGLDGGEDPTWLGGCMSMIMFETLGGATPSIDLFRSKIGRLPGVVVVWDGSQPADGTTQSSVERGRSRVGPNAQLFKEQFNLFVVTSRNDSGHKRQNEGLKLLEDLTGWITDAKEADDQVFSSPTGVQVRGRGRIAGKSEAFQHLYIYVLQVSVTTSLTRYDKRTFVDWLTTRMKTETFEKDDNEERITTTDQIVDMTTE